jgi:hypothetical protein
MDTAGIFRFPNTLRILRGGPLGEARLGSGQGMLFGGQFLGENLAAQSIAFGLPGGGHPHVGGGYGASGAQ